MKTPIWQIRQLAKWPEIAAKIVGFSYLASCQHQSSPEHPVFSSKKATSAVDQNKTSTGETAAKPEQRLRHQIPLHKRRQHTGSSDTTANRGDAVPPKSRRRQSQRISSPVFALLATVCLTGAIGHRFYNQPKLDVGTEAPRTIVAPESAQVIDTATTEQQRKAARFGAFPALTIDNTVNEKIRKNLKRLLEQANQLREIAGPFPYVSTSILSLETQRYLRSANGWEWNQILKSLPSSAPELQPEPFNHPSSTSEVPSNQQPNAAQTAPSPMPNTEEEFVSALREQAVTGLYRGLSNMVGTTSERTQTALSALKSAHQQLSKEEFQNLLEDIEQARQRYFRALSALSPNTSTGIPSIYDARLLEISDKTWETTRNQIQQTATEILTQGIPPGLPDRILRETVQLQVKQWASSPADEIASEILLQVLQPNLVKDEEQTRRRAEQAAQAIEPVVVSVRKGEVIVESGETITEADFVLLDRFDLTQRGINWRGLLGLGGVVAASVGVYLLVERKFYCRARRRDRFLILILSLSAPLLGTIAPSFLSLPAVGLLVGSFYGSTLGATVVVLLTAVLPIGLGIDVSYLIAAAAGGLVGSIAAGKMRSREELALLGLGVGVAQGGVYLVGALIASATAETVWYTLGTTSAMYGLAGLAWSVVAMGVSPYLEHLFDLVTPIRLAELANPNRPMLKRLAAQAPGTFQHTLFVATLAESAAKALGANVELVRAGTLYHDIGKMHDPQGFIENQMGGPNKHDQIDDPWKSAEIIKKHVSEGLVMANRCRLPKAIREFIPEHQGTMLIAYFYYQALQRAKEDPSLEVNESDFRYPGPIPQSRETGIVMLADSCEAALRSLEDATPEEALTMVKKIIRARWQDNQLIDSGLTRDELTKVAEIFVQVWQQFHHKRIAYPKAALAANK